MVWPCCLFGDVTIVLWLPLPEWAEGVKGGSEEAGCSALGHIWQYGWKFMPCLRRGERWSYFWH